jgi:ABC-type transport system involved in multi-copper enzyme maturation permease subunit
MHSALVIARYTGLEAWRSGLPWIALGILLAALGLSLFLSQVALAESVRVQAAIAAALLRAAAALLVAAHVVTAIAREINDKGLEFMLAQPLSRPAYYLGKLAGYGAAGFALAIVFSLPMLAWSGPAAVAAWGLSLALELLLVAAAALFFAMALAQPAAALAASAGLYLLARTMGAIQAIASGPQSEGSAFAAAAQWAVDGVSLVLPRLDLATQSAWLLYGAPGGAEMGRVLGALMVYTALLAVAGLFDLSRRNL